MTYFHLNEPDVSAEHFDNEVLAVNIVTGRYYTIKGASAIFLRLVLDGNSIDSSTSKIAELFSIEETVAKEDFSSFVVELIAEKLVIETSVTKEVSDSSWLSNADVTVYLKPSIEIHKDMEELVLLSVP